MVSRTNLLGNLPVYEKGPNKGRLKRKAAADFVNLSLEEFSKAYNNWIQIFRKENSTLTFEEYLGKMKEVNITPNNLGNNLYDYHLCRDNDEGGYHKYNCRFKLKSENLEEQKHELIYINMLNKYGKEKTRQLLSEYGKMAWK